MEENKNDKNDTHCIAFMLRGRACPLFRKTSKRQNGVYCLSVYTTEWGGWEGRKGQKNNEQEDEGVGPRDCLLFGYAVTHRQTSHTL